MTDRPYKVLLLCTGDSALPLASIEKSDLKARLREIGQPSE